MYSGLNKGDGAVVGPVQRGRFGEVELEEAVAMSSADEVVFDGGVHPDVDADGERKG